MKALNIVVLMVILAFGILAAEPLSTQYQQDLISRLEYLRGTGPRPASMDSSQGTPHCGTSILFDAYINRDNLSAPYKQLAIQLTARPILPLSFVSPDGHFLIHYTITGSDSVYQSSNDTLVGGNSIPIYVYRIGQIADSVWNFEIGHLGYPTPPSDGSYPAGDGPEYDIYIFNLGSAYYGQTFMDSAFTNTTATSFMAIDNDYNFIPYSNRPLDAARVTIAHEFFHAIHFGMDYREFDFIGSDPQLYWWEMSATWMEEMAYTNINDYYGYLPYYFNYPWVSLLDFSLKYSLHPYGSVLFPLYLSQRWDTVIVRDIWFKCRAFHINGGSGAHFLIAADSAIQDLSGGSYDLRKAFSEFALWNIFTGSRTPRAPAGYKYLEAANYPLIPDSAFITHPSVPDTMLWSWPDSVPGISAAKMTYFKARVPDNLGANYINFSTIYNVPDSIRILFYGISSPPINLQWNLSTAVEPLSGSAPYQLTTQDQPPLTPITEAWPTPSNLRMLAIVSQATLDKTAHPGAYGFTYIVGDTAGPPPPTPHYYVKINAPYPNPVTAGTEAVQFQVQGLVKQDHVAKLGVTIFDISGSRVKEITLPHTGINPVLGTQTWGAEWSLDNGKNQKIAPGVYLALCKVTFDDGTPEVVSKFKLAVIK